MSSSVTLTACERNAMSKPPCRNYPMSKRCTAQLKKALRKCPPYKSITSNIDQQRAVDARIRQLRGVRTAMMKQIGGRTYKQNRAKMMSTTERKQAAFALKAPTTSTDAAANFLYQQALAAKNKATQEAQTPKERDSSKQERIDARGAQQAAEVERGRYASLVGRAGQVAGGPVFGFPPGGGARRPKKRKTPKARKTPLAQASARPEPVYTGAAAAGTRRKRARSDEPTVVSDDPSPPASPAPQFSFTPPTGAPAQVGLAGVRARTDQGTGVIPLGPLAPAVVNQTVAQARRQPTNGIGGGGTISDIGVMTPSRALRPSANTVRRSTLGGLNSASPFLGGQPPRGGTLSDTSLLSGQRRPRPPPGPPGQPAIHSDVAARLAGRRRLEDQRRLQAGRELSASTGQVSSTETDTGITFHSY